MIECVIFDCDGTLVDSEYLCNLALAQLLSNIGITEDASLMQARFRGWKLARILESLSEKHHISFSTHFVPDYRKLVAELFQAKLRPTVNVHIALEEIALPKCVASSGPLAKIRQALDLTKLANFFQDRLFSSYQIQSWKPEPDLIFIRGKTNGLRT